jgi:outer membrane protein assembly factor BamD (BamD/ComL family)
VARGSVAEEARLLRDANAALQGGDAAGALALLDEHRRAYPKGTLSEESMAERVFALCRMGRAAEAHQEARRFLQSYPKSPLTKRVRDSCGLSPRNGEASR